MKLHFAKFANFLKKNYLKNNSKIIEIGSNDGTFLSNFKNDNLQFVGFEPSGNVAKLANKLGVKTINSFFNKNAIDLIKNFKNKTDLIFAANVICHIPNLSEVIETIDKFLSQDGIFVFEEPYLGSMFEKVSYDQIYDEHIFMFSATSVKKIFNLFDFELIDIYRQSTHGGSMRYVISRKNKKKINKNVKIILDEEKKNNLNNIQSCLEFKSNCEISREQLNEKINKLLYKGKRIVGYAATSKSTTILNYCDIGKNKIEYICDTTKEKVGKYSPGMHIPIVSIEKFRSDNPDVAYLFAWNHKKEILNKEKLFTRKKGKWISHVNI